MSGPWKSGFYDLLRAAKRRDDSQTENIRYALNQMVASTPPEIVP